MSVLLETSLGDIVLDLHTELCPTSCLNFLKLCSIHYYVFSPFLSVQKGFIAQTGDPHASSSNQSKRGGQSIFNLLSSSSTQHSQVNHFNPELPRTLNHRKRGTVSFSCSNLQKDTNNKEDGGDAILVAASQFFITLADDIDYLDGKHAPFATVVEGMEQGGTLDKIEAAFVDERNRPLRDIRIQRAVVLDDPFPDPSGLVLPSRTPSPTPSQLQDSRLDASLPSPTGTPPPLEEQEEAKRKSDKTSAALTLEMVGDLPFAEVRPPENILFVCKLNPVTRSEDLELIFSRFGKILSCEVVKDRKTGDSLQYAFIEFDEQKSAEQAYFKMQSVLVDDRRIQVDFSQSVSKLHGDWLFKRTGGRMGGRLGGGSGSNSINMGSSSGSRNGGDRGMVFDFDRRSTSSSGRDSRDRNGKDRDRNDRYQQDRSRDKDQDRRRDFDDRDRNRVRDRHSSSSSRRDDERRDGKSKSRWDDKGDRRSISQRERSPRDDRDRGYRDRDDSNRSDRRDRDRDRVRDHPKRR